jgi:hypothetical protein
LLFLVIRSLISRCTGSYILFLNPSFTVPIEASIEALTWSQSIKEKKNRIYGIYRSPNHQPSINWGPM